MFSRLFGTTEKETVSIDLGQAEIIIQLYTGQIIKKLIKGVHDKVFGCYSPCSQQIKYFMEKVRKENVLEIEEGHFINIAKEIKSVTVGEISPLIIEVDKD